MVPDFTDPFIAAIGAAVASRAMPTLWKMFEHEAKISVLRDTHAAEVERAARIFNLTHLDPWIRQPPTAGDKTPLRRRNR